MAYRENDPVLEMVDVLSDLPKIQSHYCYGMGQSNFGPNGVQSPQENRMVKEIAFDTLTELIHLSATTHNL